MLPTMPTKMQLQETIEIPDLIFRHTRGVDDTDALFAVHARRRLHDHLDPVGPEREIPRREEVQAMLSQLSERGQSDRVLVAEAAGQAVGYSRVSSWREGDGMVVLLILGWVLPEWRRKGIGSTMLHWGEERARDVAATEYPGEKFEFAANASSTEHEAAELLRHEGYTVGYNVLQMEWAQRDLAHAPLPPGVELRPASRKHAPLITASTDEAYRNEYPGNRFMEISDLEEYAASLAGPQHDPELWQVAWEGDQVVGQVLPQIIDNRGEMFEVSVRPASRRKGVARALLTRGLQALVDRGVETIRLVTIAEFPTCAWALYESVGFRTVKTFPRYRKPAW